MIVSERNSDQAHHCPKTSEQSNDWHSRLRVAVWQMYEWTTQRGQASRDGDIDRAGRPAKGLRVYPNFIRLHTAVPSLL